MGGLEANPLSSATITLCPSGPSFLLSRVPVCPARGFRQSGTVFPVEGLESGPVAAVEVVWNCVSG